MKSAYESLREDQLERKLQFLLGSQKDWLLAYATWCHENSVSETESRESHNINLFVREQKAALPARAAPQPVPQKRG